MDSEPHTPRKHKKANHVSNYLHASGQSASQTFKKFTKSLPLTGPESQKRIDEKIRKNTAKADSVITIIQAIILILAALVWGFGDLATC